MLLEEKTLGIEDEFFGEDIIDDSDALISKEMTLVATMEQARTGRLGDIIATIQGEQDEIIRAPLAGPLVVQGGPELGKQSLLSIEQLISSIPIDFHLKAKEF